MGSIEVMSERKVETMLMENTSAHCFLCVVDGQLARRLVLLIDCPH